MEMLRLILFVIYFIEIESHQEWSYREASNSGPRMWNAFSRNCNGRKQSPIDLPKKGPWPVPVKFRVDEDMEFVNYDLPIEDIYAVKNNGHTIQVNVPKGKIAIRKGGLPATYVLEQFHFHWGNTNERGSEHTVGGKFHGMELHLVHYNSDKYSNVSEALKDPTGLAVLGVFIDVGSISNTMINRIVTILPHLQIKNVLESVAPFPMKAVLPSKSFNFYRYEGSLTTPTCDESVIWTVFHDPIYITADMMNAFRQAITDGNGLPLNNNYRPVQPRNDRPVCYHEQSASW